MKSKKVSFCMLTWNRKSMMEDAINALVNSIKNPSECEIIVYDDNSTDGTRDVLSYLQVKHGGNIQFNVIFNNEGQKRLNAYKELFSAAQGEFIVEVDDDVIDYYCAPDVDIVKSLESGGICFACLDVVQNEMTNGAKPGREHYQLYMTPAGPHQIGPVGGWCTGFKRSDYLSVKDRFESFNLTMSQGEDGVMSMLLREQTGLMAAVIFGKYCLHASGEKYSAYYGNLVRDEQKYRVSGLDEFADRFKG